MDQSAPPPSDANLDIELDLASASILVVDDHEQNLELIQAYLEDLGCRVRISADALEALAMIESDPPDLIILDVMMPRMSGYQLCTKVKADPATRDIPIVMVTAKGEESDIVVGLELGADDYITKPFSPKVLMARVKTVLRRAEPVDANHLVIAGGAISIDAQRHVVSIEGENVELTLTQYRLLHFLAQRPGFVRTRDQMVSAVRGEGAVLSSRVIDVHVAALRQKLGEFGDLIETVRGVGYRLTDARVPESA